MRRPSAAFGGGARVGGKAPEDRAQSCAVELHNPAGWETRHNTTMTKTVDNPSVTASPRGGVESNRRRTGGPQETNPIRRGERGELPGRGRSLKHTQHAALAWKALLGRTLWLGVERQEGEAR